MKSYPVTNNVNKTGTESLIINTKFDRIFLVSKTSPYFKNFFGGIRLRCIPFTYYIKIKLI